MTGAFVVTSNQPPQYRLFLLTAWEERGQDRGIDAELQKAFFNPSVALIFGALIGGIVRLLIDDHQELKAQRVNDAQFITNVLADLKTVYDRVERARILIPAHQSALTYGKEMRDLKPLEISAT